VVLICEEGPAGTMGIPQSRQSGESEKNWYSSYSEDQRSLNMITAVVFIHPNQSISKRDRGKGRSCGSRLHLRKRTALKDGHIKIGEDLWLLGPNRKNLGYQERKNDVKTAKSLIEHPQTKRKNCSREVVRGGEKALLGVKVGRGYFVKRIKTPYETIPNMRGSINLSAKR